MGLFGIQDLGFFRKKIENGGINKNFRYTKGGCKTFGSRVVDIMAIGATLCFIAPIIIDVFDKDSKDDGNFRGEQRRKQH